MKQVQLVIDSLLPLAAGTAPFFIMEYYYPKDPDHPTYDKRQLLLCNIALVFEYVSQILYAIALNYGKASRVQAI